jgi:phosphatidyl-myo-inositol dimannoside synthase
MGAHTDFMRVCILTTSYPRWQGDTSGPFVESLVHKLIAECGCSVCVVAPHAPGAAEIQRHDRLEIHRFRYAWPGNLQQLCYNGGIPASMQIRPWTVSLVPSLLAGFVRAATHHMASCDVVHCQWMFSGYVGLLARTTCFRPIVVTAHGSDVSLAQHLWPFRTLNRHVIRRADAVTTVGSLQRGELVRLGADPGKVKHVALGVEDEFLDRPVQRDKTIDLVFVGRLTPEKRPELLLAALADLARRGIRMKASLVGDGPLRRSLEQFIQRENLTDVRLLGPLPHRQVLDVMDQARCLVLVSSREGMPTVVTEAMARGLAVLTCNVGSVADVVSDGLTGCLMPADVTAAQVAGRIQEIFCDPSRIEAMGLAARDLMRAQYTWRNSARRFHDLYLSLIGKQQSSVPTARPR